MKTFLEAVATMEGFYKNGSRPQRLNNPGDIEAGRFAIAHGALGHADSRFALFPDVATGFAAMRALLQAPNYRGLTVEQALNRWAPVVENNTSHYIETVCWLVGCKPTDVIDDLVRL